MKLTICDGCGERAGEQQKGWYELGIRAWPSTADGATKLFCGDCGPKLDRLLRDFCITDDDVRVRRVAK